MTDELVWPSKAGGIFENVELLVLKRSSGPSSCRLPTSFCPFLFQKTSYQEARGIHLAPSRFGIIVSRKTRRQALAGEREDGY
jgi:hypothetical protein